MTAKKKQKPTSEKAAPTAAAENPNELREAIWSVISFDRTEASGLTYIEAEAELAALAARRVSGLCIVTDAAAARIRPKSR